MSRGHTIMWKANGHRTSTEILVKLSQSVDRADAPLQVHILVRSRGIVRGGNGNFQDGTIPGKVQFGSAWWFLDQREGMEMQLNALSNLGLLSRFVGMVTDSRSFMS